MAGNKGCGKMMKGGDKATPHKKSGVTPAFKKGGKVKKYKDGGEMSSRGMVGRQNKSGW